MKRFIPLVAVIGCTILCADSALGSRDYWTHWTEKPQYIVVGKLKDVKTAEFECFSRLTSDSTRTFQSYDAGWVEVEEVLWGDMVASRVPIAWSASTIDDTASGRTSWRGTTGRSFKPGHRMIWVVMAKIANPNCEIEPYSHFAAYPLEDKKKIAAEIDEHCHRPWKTFISWNDVAIRLARSSCAGDCPEYEVAIRGNGTVEFRGKERGTDAETKSWQIDSRDLVTLLNEFLQAGFFSHGSEFKYRDFAFIGADGGLYTRRLWDAGGRTDVLSLKFGEREHVVCLTWGRPAVLEELVEAIEEVAREGGCFASDGE